MKSKSNLIERIYRAGLISAIAISVEFILLAFLPFEVLKPVVDRLAPDGDLEVFSAALHADLAPWLGGLGLLLALAAGLAVWKPEAARGLLGYIEAFLSNWRADARTFFGDIRESLPPNQSAWLLLGITLAGLVLRLMILDRPMEHDESYTFVAFASKNFRTVLTDYHLPNNHIFHSILVRISYLLFGEGPGVVRLPALLSGVLLIPAVYVVGRNYFNEWAGVLAAGLVAFNPELMLYSTNARGYALVALWTVLIWGVANYLHDHKNVFGWSLLTALATLGFYTIPTMFYPFGAVMLWLAFSYLLKDYETGYGKYGLLAAVVLSGLAVVVLTVLLYAPIFIEDGLGVVTSNGIIQELQDDSYLDFIQNFRARSLLSFNRWHRGIPAAVKGLMAVGFLLGAGFHKQVSKRRVAFVLPLAVWIFGVLNVQQTMAWDRVWSFLLPVYLLYCAAGWGWVIQKIAGWRSARWVPYGVGLMIALIAAVPVVWMNTDATASAWVQGGAGEVEQATQFLADYLDEGDIVMVIPPDNPMFWYYARLYGIPRRTYSIQEGYQRVLVAVNVERGQTVESVATAHGGLDGSQDFQAAELIYGGGVLAIYQLGE